MVTWQEKRDRFLLRFGTVGLAVLLVTWVVADRTPDPSLLIAFTGILGAPSVLRRDEGR